MKDKWRVKIEATLDVAGEADSLSDLQHLVCTSLGGLFAEDELDQSAAGLRIISMMPVNVSE